MRIIIAAVSIMALAVCPATMASASIRVGFVADGLSSQDQTDIMAYLIADARVSSATLYDVTSGTLPSLATLLSSTDAILMVTDFGQNNANDTTLGDRLADYVDAGHGIVLATFAWNPAVSIGMAGRIMTSGYSPFSNQPG